MIDSKTYKFPSKAKILDSLIRALYSHPDCKKADITLELQLAHKLADCFNSVSNLSEKRIYDQFCREVTLLDSKTRPPHTIFLLNCLTNLAIQNPTFPQEFSQDTLVSHRELGHHSLMLNAAIKLGYPSMSHAVKKLGFPAGLYKKEIDERKRDLIRKSHFTSS